VHQIPNRALKSENSVSRLCNRLVGIFSDLQLLPWFCLWNSCVGRLGQLLAYSGTPCMAYTLWISPVERTHGRRTVMSLQAGICVTCKSR